MREAVHEQRSTGSEGVGPLTGVRVVDFTEYIAGPSATMMLADMGATVLKVEPVAGDHWRHQAPIAPNESRGIIGVNRDKRSVAIDVWQPEGRALAHRLTATADVVLVNYRPGVAVELGLDYASVRGRNPRVVYAEITAFGRQGPYRDGRASTCSHRRLPESWRTRTALTTACPPAYGRSRPPTSARVCSPRTPSPVRSTSGH